MSLDTHAAAATVQAEVLRRLGPAGRTLAGARLSMAARATTLAAIRQRHPQYDDQTARWALFRVLLGDELFHKVWPVAPLVAP
ncbi:MAG TPA: hypothetical protein VFQ65_05285 [Kofleriaceae bacterium]|nr:hypothetical protein [Kofleriaceae bacterium]